jgi:hypothetical protein
MILSLFEIALIFKSDNPLVTVNVLNELSSVSNLTIPFVVAIYTLLELLAIPIVLFIEKWTLQLFMLFWENKTDEVLKSIKIDNINLINN